MPSDRQREPSPWTSVFLRPRQTLRHVLAKRSEAWILSVAVAEGFVNALERASAKAWGDSYSLPLVLALALAAGAFSGVLYLYVWGFLISWTGRWLGGVADAREVRVAITLPNLVLLWSAPFWVPELLLLGNEMFKTQTPPDGGPGLGGLLFVHGLVQIVLVVWGLVTYLTCLSEVQRFSVWKTIANLLLAFLAVFVPLMLVILILL